jgi:NAD(P)H-hydrate epimerase
MEYLPEALYRAAEVRAADRRAAEQHGLGGGVLMERAGAAALSCLRERFPRARRLAVFCGPGNNGGDGFVLARRAREAGLEVTVTSLSDPAALQGDAQQAWQRWHAAGGATVRFGAGLRIAADVVVDGLFGTGLARAPEGAARAAVDAINGAGCPVLALDIPSGLHADSGRVLGVAVRADVTLSFIGLKAGLFTGLGREHSGLILFDALGVPHDVFSGAVPLARRITPASLYGLLPRRPRQAHKGMAGRVGVLGGQPGMPGAVRLAGEAAYRGGAGLVTLATHPAHAALISAACPELISHGVMDPREALAALASCSVVAFGPGLGQQDWGRALWKAALSLQRPLVVDADALNLLAGERQRRSDWVLTPHPGEAARLLGCTPAAIEADRFAAVRTLVDRYGGVCVLKGSGTLVASEHGPDLWLCDRGNPGMASGGTGDVLTGVIAALCAQGLTPVEAARLGVWAHAVAGDRAAQNGERGMLARDLLAPLRAVLNEREHADRAHG